MFTSKWFSTGGDEINQKCYDNDAPTQAALKAAGLTFEQVRFIDTSCIYFVLIVTT